MAVVRYRDQCDVRLPVLSLDGKTEACQIYRCLPLDNHHYTRNAIGAIGGLKVNKKDHIHSRLLKKTPLLGLRSAGYERPLSDPFTAEYDSQMISEACQIWELHLEAVESPSELM